MPADVGSAVAWAFTQWGGQFYFFISTVDVGGTTHTSVQTVDRATGAFAVRLADAPHLAVAAAASTCAPLAP